MAVEVFNTTGYIFESSAANPELAVFLRNASPYILEAPAVNSAFAVFVLGFSSYTLSGRAKPNSVYLADARIYEVAGPHASKIGYHRPTFHTVIGGPGGNGKVALPITKFYMITN